MRALVLSTLALGGLMLSAAPASAQTLYVCTPSAQVLEVASGVTTVLFTGTGSFHDCVFGPDSRLYIANDTSILRLNTDGTSPSVVASGLPSAARGLAFNVTTLYINTASSGVQKMVGTAPLLDGDPLVFSAPTSAFTLSTSGQGVVFDVQGNMVLASNSKLLTSPPLYSSAADLVPSGITPFGVAVDTCKQVVFADASTNTIQRVAGSGPGHVNTGVSFIGDDGVDPVLDIPRYIEVASNNDMFIVTTHADGLGAKVWHADFNFATQTGIGGEACPSALNSTTKLVDLADELSDELDDLINSSAMGIALAPTDHAITKTFSNSVGGCEQTYDFGYHRMRLTFSECALAFPLEASAGIKVEALKSTLAQVTFNPADFPNSPIEGMRYSVMGGLLVQYQITVASGSTPFPTPHQVVLFFNTQEIVKIPGVARGPDGINSVYDDDVSYDYWAVTTDDPGGGRGDDISKRVMFNSAPPAGQENCTLDFEPPFKNGTPQYNAGQSATIKVRLQNCGTGVVTLRVSVSEGTGTTFNDIEVKSKGNLEPENRMQPTTSPGQFIYHLDTTGYSQGDKTVTISGTAAPITKTLTIGKSK